MLPRLYAILDSACVPSPGEILQVARELLEAGVTLFQYRNKSSTAAQMLADARTLRHVVGQKRLIMNDRADLCLAAECDGVHLGQDDLTVAGARRVVGQERWVGISTHNLEQVRDADRTSATYIAIGPVFATASKANPDPVVGIEGVRAARALTRKPLVAIGGITRQNCRSVIEAGADSVAVISDLLGSPRESAEAFLRQLE
jgi:thiamine-phosphate pyrophosphorylase